MPEENNCRFENGSLKVCPELHRFLNGENAKKDGITPHGAWVGANLKIKGIYFKKDLIELNGNSAHIADIN